VPSAAAVAGNAQLYKQAEDHERQEQWQTASLSTDMMQASKQSPGLAPALRAAAQTPTSRRIGVVNVPSDPAARMTKTPGTKCLFCAQSASRHGRHAPVAASLCPASLGPAPFAAANYSPPGRRC
jgi:hypothetical protein